jgi:hypothetical protein
MQGQRDHEPPTELSRPTASCSSAPRRWEGSVSVLSSRYWCPQRAWASRGKHVPPPGPVPRPHGHASPGDADPRAGPNPARARDHAPGCPRIDLGAGPIRGRQRRLGERRGRGPRARPRRLRVSPFRCNANSLAGGMRRSMWPTRRTLRHELTSVWRTEARMIGRPGPLLGRCHITGLAEGAATHRALLQGLPPVRVSGGEFGLRAVRSRPASRVGELVQQPNLHLATEATTRNPTQSLR